MFIFFFNSLPTKQRSKRTKCNGKQTKAFLQSKRTKKLLLKRDRLSCKEEILRYKRALALFTTIDIYSLSILITFVLGFEQVWASIVMITVIFLPSYSSFIYISIVYCNYLSNGDYLHFKIPFFCCFIFCIFDFNFYFDVKLNIIFAGEVKTVRLIVCFIAPKARHLQANLSDGRPSDWLNCCCTCTLCTCGFFLSSSCFVCHFVARAFEMWFSCFLALNAIQCLYFCSCLWWEIVCFRKAFLFEFFLVFEGNFMFVYIARN